VKKTSAVFLLLLVAVVTLQLTFLAEKRWSRLQVSSGVPGSRNAGAEGVASPGLSPLPTAPMATPRASINTVPRTPQSRRARFSVDADARRQTAPAKREAATRAYLQLPLDFEVNQGQAPSRFKYVAHGPGYALGLAPGTASLSFETAPQPRNRSLTPVNLSRSLPERRYSGALEMRLLGASDNTTVVGEGETKTRSNYFIGNDPAQWHQNISHFSRVKMLGVYPGVDLTFYGNPQQLEYDFIVAPGADPKAIRLQIKGSRGIHLDRAGNAVLRTAAGEVQLKRPSSYQLIDGVRQAVATNFQVADRGELEIAVGPYDHHNQLVIDPVLTHSATLGGANGNQPSEIVSVELDAAGNVYVSGDSCSDDFPTTGGPFQGNVIDNNAKTCVEAFVAKFDPTLSTLIFSDFIGGTSGISAAWYLGVDATNNIYVTGSTNAPDFPTLHNAGQTAPPVSCGVSTTGAFACPEAFLIKLSADGSQLAFSSLLGGSQATVGQILQLDPVTNDVVITGSTNSADFKPAATTLLTAYPGGTCASNIKCFATYLYAFDPNTGAVDYGTFIGGAGSNFVAGMEIDNNGAIYLAGSNQKPFASALGSVTHNYPPAGGVAAGGTDIFVMKLNRSAQNALSVAYTTVIQGELDEGAASLTVDGAGNVYAVGSSASHHLPVTAGAFQATNLNSNPSNCSWASAIAPVMPELCGNGFVTKLDSTGALSWLTYLGGSDQDMGEAIAQDSDGNLWVGGVTSSANFPFSADAYMTAADSLPAINPFLAEMSNDGTKLPFATLIAGNFGLVSTITTDSNDNVFVAGRSSVVPTTPGVYPSNPEIFSPAFVQEWNATGKAPVLQISATNVSFADTAIGSVTAPQTVTVSNTGPGPMELAIQLTQVTVESTPNDFLETNNCPASLAASATCTISVTFQPGAPSPFCGADVICASSRAAQISVASNAPGGARAIALGGTSDTGATVQVSPNPVAFPGQAAGTTSANIDVQVSNDGNLALTISNVAITGANAADFSFSLVPTSGGPACTKPVASGGSTCVVEVAFRPAAGATGTRTANLVLSDTGIGSPHSFPLTGIVAGSTLNISPTTIAMGSQGVVGTGGNTTAGFTITNPGNASLQVTAVTVTGTNASEFTASNASCASAPPFNLAAGASCFYDLAFTAAAGAKGLQAATVTISGPGLTNVPTVSLSTNVVGATDPAIALISVPNPQDFGSALVGQTTGPNTHLLSISNVTPIPCPGGAASCGGPLNISSIAATSSEYTVTSQGGPAYCTLPPLSIPSGGSACSFQLAFTPSAAGNRNSTLNVVSNDPRGTLSLPLLGTGLALPIAILAPGNLNFGNSQIGAASPAQTVTLTNAGKGALGATTVTASTNFAVVANNCNQSIAVGASCTITASFTPPAAGSFNGALTLSNNATFGGKQTVALTGTGDTGALLLVSPSLLDFFDQPANITSLPQTVTLTNTGNVAVPLPAGAIRITTAYAISASTCGSNLAVGGSCKLGITYTPPASGNPMGGTLLISDNAKGSPQPVYLGGSSPLDGVHPSTTTVTSSANPVAAGQPVTFTATVTSTFTGGVPSGTIFFVDGTTTIGTAVLDGTSHATFTTSSLAGGTHAISAAYGASGLFLASNSASINQVVTGGVAPATTSTSLASSLNPSTVGASVTFTATVTSATAGTITGTVTFKDGTTTLGTGTINAGMATFSTSSLAQGSHSVTAVYGGDTNFATSTSTAVSQVVNASSKAATTTLVTSSKNPSTTGQSVTFTTTVSSSTAGAISGTVTFLDGATSLGTGPVGAGGVATFTTTSLTAASHSITAQYGGDANFAASTSAVLTQVVNAATKAATSTALTAAPNPSTNGQSVTFTATTTSTTAGTITGTTTFLDGATTLGTGTVGANGVATFSTTSLSTATHSVTAQYGGDSNFSASTSAAVTQTVNAPAPDFSVTAAPSSLLVSSGHPGVVTFSVAPLNGSTQTVAFSCGNVPSNISCTFSVPSVTLDGKTTATSQAMIQVAAAGAIPATPAPLPRILQLLTLFMSIGLTLGAMRIALRIVTAGNYPRRLNRAGALALLLLVFALASCNGGSRKGTTSTINLTATSGSTVHSATVTVTVK
jgi:hypothetical protein